VKIGRRLYDKKNQYLVHIKSLKVTKDIIS